MGLKAMSTEQDQIRSVAERIARRLASRAAATPERRDAEAGDAAGELSALRDTLAELQQRLAHIESHIGHDEGCEGAPRSGSESRGGRPGEAGGGAGGGAAAGGSVTPTRSLWLSGTYVPATAHPSEERFGVDEAVAELVDYFEREKTCNVEPGGKPCDHCGMCSSRGF